MDSDKAVANLNELKKDANEIKQYFQVVAEGLRNIHPK
jgi:hypothetical protein